MRGNSNPYVRPLKATFERSWALKNEIISLFSFCAVYKKSSLKCNYKFSTKNPEKENNYLRKKKFFFSYSLFQLPFFNYRLLFCLLASRYVFS